jgi:hypothetical protein
MTRHVTLLCLLALGMADCSSPAGPGSGPCTQETVFSGQDQIAANTYLVQPITTNQTGWLVVTMDWVSPVNIVSLALAQAPCTSNQFQEDHCNVILNLFPPPKPLEGTTFWLNAGSYDLLLGNFSPVAETASTKITLMSVGCPVPGQE